MVLHKCWLCRTASKSARALVRHMVDYHELDIDDLPPLLVDTAFNIQLEMSPTEFAALRPTHDEDTENVVCNHCGLIMSIRSVMNHMVAVEKYDSHIVKHWLSVKDGNAKRNQSGTRCFISSYNAYQAAYGDDGMEFDDPDNIEYTDGNDYQYAIGDDDEGDGNDDEGDGEDGEEVLGSWMWIPGRGWVGKCGCYCTQPGLEAFGYTGKPSGSDMLNEPGLPAHQP